MFEVDAVAGVVRPELLPLARPDPPTVDVVTLPPDTGVGDSRAANVNGENEGLPGDDMSKCEAPPPPPGSVKIFCPLVPAVPGNILPPPPAPKLPLKMPPPALICPLCPGAWAGTANGLNAVRALCCALCFRCCCSFTIWSAGSRTCGLGDDSRSKNDTNNSENDWKERKLRGYQEVSKTDRSILRNKTNG